MKKMLLFLFLLAPLYVMAEEIPVVVITQDSIGNRTLTFTLAEDSTATGKNGELGTYRIAASYSLGFIPVWVNYRPTRIKKVVFDKNFHSANITSTAYWFYNLDYLKTIDGLENLNTDNVTDMSNMFHGCSSLTSLDVSNFKTDNVTNMSDMFFGCSKLTSLDVSCFKTDKVTNMTWMFGGCSSLTSLDVSNFKTDNVTDMGYMFYGCSSLTSLDVSNFKTDSVTYISGMFYDCSGLTSIDVSHFNTENVVRMFGMFYNCSGLTSLNVSNFKTNNVISMQSMFFGCTGLTNLDVSNFKTDGVIYMHYMFYGCSGLKSLDISNFNISDTTMVDSMFYDCSSLMALNVGNNDFKNNTSLDGMYGKVGTSTSPCKLTVSSSFDKLVLGDLNTGNGTPDYYIWRDGYFTLDDSATGIKGVVSETADANALAYNLAGLRVGKDYKGVVIVNGKKVLRK